MDRNNSKGSEEHIPFNEDENNKLKKTTKMKKKVTTRDKRGVVLLSHIPHGFYEPQMFQYFSQFGDVTRLTLMRSKKTGRSRQFAFIEFEYEEVAKVVAETMNNYLMFQKILKCVFIPEEKVKPNTFLKKAFRIKRTRKLAIKEHNAIKTDTQIEKRKLTLLKNRSVLQERLNAMGIDYDVMNIKVNESFVPLERTRATAEDMVNIKRDIKSYYTTNERENSGKGRDEVEDEDDTHEGESEKADGEDKGDESLVDNNSAETKNKEDLLKTAKESKENAADETEARESLPKNEFGVMVVDLDDSEITFKSPPQHARIKRKSIGLTPKRKLQKVVFDDDSMGADLETVDDKPKSGEKKKLEVSKKKSLTTRTQIPDKDGMEDRNDSDDKGSDDIDTVAVKLQTPTKRKKLSLKRKTPKTDKKMMLALKRKMLNETV